MCITEDDLAATGMAAGVGFDTGVAPAPPTPPLSVTPSSLRASGLSRRGLAVDMVDGLRPHRLLEPVGDEAGGIGTPSTDLDTARVTTDIHTERASGHDTSSQLTCSSVQQLVGWLPKAPSDPRGIAQGASAVDGFRRVSPPRPGSTHAEEVEVTTLQPDEQTEWLDPFKDLYATVDGESVLAASSRTAFTSTPVVDSAVTGFLVPAVPSVPVVFLLLPFRRWSLCPVVLIRALLSNGFLGVTRTSAARRRRRVWSSALMRRAWTPAVGVAWQWRCALAALGIASAHCSRHELASSRTQEWPLAGRGGVHGSASTATGTGIGHSNTRCCP